MIIGSLNFIIFTVILTYESLLYFDPLQSFKNFLARNLGKQ